MKGKKQKQQEAAKRQLTYDLLSTKERLEKLSNNGYTAIKEKSKLTLCLEERLSLEASQAKIKNNKKTIKNPKAINKKELKAAKKLAKKS